LHAHTVIDTNFNLCSANNFSGQTWPHEHCLQAGCPICHATNQQLWKIHKNLALLKSKR